MSDGTKGPVPVVGIKADNYARPPMRMELRDLKSTQPDQWNLFLQGMERFMDPTKEKNPLSFYQISGIHGLPYTNWPNEEWNKNEKIVDKDDGYCTHSSILFLTWHRPYLALYEQALYKHVNDIAQEYGTEPAERRDAYIKAAKDFRMPYWDWAIQNTADVTLFPKEVWASTIPNVIRPRSQGKPTPMRANPLASYQFGDVGKSDSNIDKFPSAGTTLRWPNRAGTQSQETLVQNRLAAWKIGQTDASRGKNLTERVFWILTAYTYYDAMCCNIYTQQQQGWSNQQPGWDNWGSLEDIHNAVHTYVGGSTGGHMASIQVSAFDPVFWLHHTNIDRLCAIWQALHDDTTSNPTFVAPNAGSAGTRTIDPGSGQTAETLLAPFNETATNGAYWTSTKVKDTKVFGHVYPETRDWVYKTKAEITNRLIDLYSYGSLSSMFKRPAAASNLASRATLHSLAAQVPLKSQAVMQSMQTEGAKLPEHIEQKAASIQIPTDRDLSNLLVDGKYLEWLVDIKAEKHANNGDFVVHVFLGDPEDDDPTFYIFNHSHVAAFSTMGQNRQTACEKCQADQSSRMQVTGQIPLTLALVERYQAGLINGLTPEAVEPYLAQNLHWRVVSTTAQPVPRESINGLLVGVVTCEVTVPAEERALPQYAPHVVPRPAATTRRQEDWSGDQPEGRGNGTGYCGGPIPGLT